MKLATPQPITTKNHYITADKDFYVTRLIYRIAQATNVEVLVTAHTMETKGAISSFLFGQEETIHYQTKGTQEAINKFEALLKETARKAAQANTYVTHKGTLEGLSSLKLKQEIQALASKHLLTSTIKSKRRPSTHFFSERIVTCNYEVYGRFENMRNFHDAIQRLEASLKK